MRHVSIKSMIYGIVAASFVWGLLLFSLTFDYEVPKPENWSSDLLIKENPVTQDRRVVDTVEKATIFWSAGNPLVVPVEVRKLDSRRWSVTFEKP